MSKKGQRNAGGASTAATPTTAVPPPIPAQMPAVGILPPVTVGQAPAMGIAASAQWRGQLKFAEGSSFWSMPPGDQQRMLGYLAAYRKELPRLLSEGETGRFAVIQGDAVAHVWDTADDAMQAATLLVGPGQFAVYQVRPQDADRLACGEETKGPCPQ